MLASEYMNEIFKKLLSGGLEVSYSLDKLVHDIGNVVEYYTHVPNKCPHAYKKYKDFSEINACNSTLLY